MARQFIRVIGLVVAAVVMFAATAGAQEIRRVNLAGGYSLLHDFDASRNFPAGWFASFGGSVRRWFGVAGELSGNYTTIDVPGRTVNLSVHSFLAGPRFTLHRDNFSVYAQTLLGAARSGASAGTSAQTDLAVQPGGGIDLRVTDGIGVRLGANYQFLHTPNCCYSHTGSTAKELQFVAGVVVPGTVWHR
jgi:hypothetical protein